MIPVWQYVVSMLTYIIILMLLVELMRKKMKFAAVFWIVVLFSFPFWFSQLDGWFRWAKTLSVLLPIAFVVSFARIAQHEERDGWWKIFRKDWVLWFLYFILSLNIIEATIKDFVLGNYFNGFAGVILIVTLPLFKTKRKTKNGWEISKEKPGDLLVYTDWAWAFLYTTWNIAFVFAENPGYAASSLCILLAALIYPIIRKRAELYVISRVYTIGIHILIRANYDIFTPIMDSSRFANDKVVFYWGIINFALHFVYLIYYFFFKNKVQQSTVLNS